MAFVLAGSYGYYLFSKTKTAPFYVYRLPLVESVSSFEKTFSTVKDLANKNPKNTQTLNQLAELYYIRGRRTGDLADFDQARILSESSIQILKSDNRQARIMLARVDATQHRFDEAIRLANEVISEPSAYSILIPAYVAIGKLEEASIASDFIVRRAPRIGNLALRALVFFAEGRDAEGEFELQKGFALEDLGETADSTWSRCILARHFIWRGKLEQAEILIKEALRISPNYHLALDLEGQLETLQKNFAGANENFEKAFSVSHQIVYLRHSAELASIKGSQDLARDRWAQAEKLIRVELDKDLYGHKLELARILIARGDGLPEALNLALEESKARPAAESFYVLARALGANQRWEDALTAILRCLSSGVRDPQYFDFAREIYLQTGNVSRAELYASLTKELDPAFDSKMRIR